MGNKKKDSFVSIQTKLWETKELSSAQHRGMRAGLSRNQVYHNWFSIQHALAARKIQYKDYEGLPDLDVSVLTCQHLSITRKDLETLSYHQKKGIIAGLSLQQVNHNWFGANHVKAAQRRIPYATYKNLTKNQAGLLVDYHPNLSRDNAIDFTRPQIEAVMKHGLSWEQVNHSWFKAQHEDAAEAGLNYEAYEGLSEPQVAALLHDYNRPSSLTREQASPLTDLQAEAISRGLLYNQVIDPQFSNVFVTATNLPIASDDGDDTETVQLTLNKRFVKLIAECKGELPPVTSDLVDLDLEQMRGIHDGLTTAQVKSDWFVIARRNQRLFKDERYRVFIGLDDEQAELVAEGYSIDQKTSASLCR